MDLKHGDLHMILDAADRTLKLFEPGGELVFGCEARNRTVYEGFGHDAHCPPGEYSLGSPRAKNTIPFGPWFIPILDYAQHHTMIDFGRAGIGLHGGGSGLADPFADRQGWQITEGCWRLANIDLRRLVALVKPIQMAGGVVYCTVI